MIWLLVVELLSFAAVPLAYRLFKRLPDRGAAFSKVLGILLFGYALWLVGLAGLAPQSQATVWVLFLALATVSGWLAWRKRLELWDFLKRERWHLLASEAVFLAVLVGWTLIAAQVPAINHTEKPMDFGFLNALVGASSYPPEDFWLSGHPVNYYHFGHLTMSGLTILSGLPSNITYNLAMALVPALASVTVYGLLYNLIRIAGVSRLKAGLFSLAGPLFVGIASNLVGILHFFQTRGWGGSGFWEWIGIKDLRAMPGGGFFPDQFNWWWRDTRVIDTVVNGRSLDYTITEFPFFSFLLGDLHAHVMALPFLVLALGLLLNVHLLKPPPGLTWLRRNAWECAALALSIGALGFINTWDIPTLSTLFLAMLLLTGLRHKDAGLGSALLRAAIVGLPVLAIAVILFLPFYLNLESQAAGIVPLREVSTRPLHFLLIWGLFLAITAAVLVRQLSTLPPTGRRRDPFLSLTLAVTVLPFLIWAVIVLPLETFDSGLYSAMTLIGSRLAKLLPLMAIVGIAVYSALARARTGPTPLVFALALTALGFYLLMGAELFYVEDFFPLRMNTVFKLFYQAWLLLAVASAFGVYYWFSQPLPKIPAFRIADYAWVGMVSVLVLCSLYYPVGAALDRIQGSNDPATLDGLAFVKKDKPDEYEAILQLRDHAPRGVLVEAVGSSYSEHGRVASSTGLPSILNWPGHEAQWRGSHEPLAGREEDVADIYQSSSPAELATLLDKYDARYVYLGARERAKYGPVDEEKFLHSMQVYFRSGDVVVFERTSDS